MECAPAPTLGFSPCDELELQVVPHFTACWERWQPDTGTEGPAEPPPGTMVVITRAAGYRAGYGLWTSMRRSRSVRYPPMARRVSLLQKTRFIHPIVKSGRPVRLVQVVREPRRRNLASSGSITKTARTTRPLAFPMNIGQAVVASSRGVEWVLRAIRSRGTVGWTAAPASVPTRLLDQGHSLCSRAQIAKRGRPQIVWNGGLDDELGACGTTGS